MKKLIFAAIVILSACTADKEDWVVKGTNGKYYRLTNENVIGSERYRLIEIDTTQMKRF